MTTRTTELTEKQRIALKAFEGARQAGQRLSDFVKARGLPLRPVYDAVAALRERGVLPPTERAHRRKGGFVAVRVTAPASMTPSVPTRGGLVCRLVHQEGFVIECAEWPPATWVRSVMAGRSDAAA